MACLRLVTFFPELPLRSVPRFRSRITFSTFFWAVGPYFRAMATSISTSLAASNRPLFRRSIGRSPAAQVGAAHDLAYDLERPQVGRHARAMQSAFAS
jgi:hypothetical protein